MVECPCVPVHGRRPFDTLRNADPCTIKLGAVWFMFFWMMAKDAH